MSSFRDAPLVLVFDDDEQWAIEYATKLLRIGFRVEETTDERELDEMVHRHTPYIDLFVCDTQLGFSPGRICKGYDLCCILRDRALMPTAKVIGISSMDFSREWESRNFEFFSKSYVGQGDFNARAREIYREIMQKRRGF